MESYDFLKVAREDIHLLRKISTDTFLETFASVNSKENMDKYLAENLSQEVLTREVEDPQSVFCFSKSNHTVSGYVKIRFGSVPDGYAGDGFAAELQRIYVLREFQGVQVGKFLLDSAMDLCRQNSVYYLWLGVWEKNDQAIRFYKKNGFVEFGSHVFRLGNDDQTDLLMRRTL